MSHMDESCHMRMDELCHIWTSHVIYECVMSQVALMMSHVECVMSQVDESWHVRYMTLHVDMPCHI